MLALVAAVLACAHLAARLAAVAGAGGAEGAAVSVHLFADSRTIRWTKSCSSEVVLGPVTKDPDNPLLAEGHVPWDLVWLNTYPSVAYDPTDEMFKLWYNGFICCTKGQTCPSPDYPAALPTCVGSVGQGKIAEGTQSRKTATMYAHSADGKTWFQPSLGQVPWPFPNSSAANNIAFSSGTADPNRGILLDVHESNSSRRFKAFGSFNKFNGGATSAVLGSVFSENGKAWHDFASAAAMQVNADTANNAVWDPDIKQYIAFTRKDVKHDEKLFGVRREYRSVSTDFVSWSEAVECGRGEAGYELYALAPWRLPSWRAGLYMAVGMFYADGSAEEKVFCELMQSTNFGQNWTRLAPHKAWIPTGANGAFDSHTCYAARPFVDPRQPNVTLLYYAGGNGPHSGTRADYIAVATAPTNSYAGLDVAPAPLAEHWVVSTPPLQATAPRLLLEFGTVDGRAVLNYTVRGTGEAGHGSSWTGAVPGDRQPGAASAWRISRVRLPLKNPLAVGTTYTLEVSSEARVTLYSLHFVE